MERAIGGPPSGIALGCTAIVRSVASSVERRPGTGTVIAADLQAADRRTAVAVITTGVRPGVGIIGTDPGPITSIINTVIAATPGPGPEVRVAGTFGTGTSVRTVAGPNIASTNIAARTIDTRAVAGTNIAAGPVDRSIGTRAVAGTNIAAAPGPVDRSIGTRAVAGTIAVIGAGARPDTVEVFDCWGAVRCAVVRGAGVGTRTPSERRHRHGLPGGDFQLDHAAVGEADGNPTGKDPDHRGSVAASPGPDRSARCDARGRPGSGPSRARSVRPRRDLRTDR